MRTDLVFCRVISIKGLACWKEASVTMKVVASTAWLFRAILLQYSAEEAGIHALTERNHRIHAAWRQFPHDVNSPAQRLQGIKQSIQFNAYLFSFFIVGQKVIHYFCMFLIHYRDELFIFFNMPHHCCSGAGNK